MACFIKIRRHVFVTALFVLFVWLLSITFETTFAKFQFYSLTSYSTLPTESRTINVTVPNHTLALQWYTNLHDQITGKEIDQKYIIYSPVGGYGNRMSGLLSTLLFGLISKRALLVRDWPTLGHNIEVPFQVFFLDKENEYETEFESTVERRADQCFYADYVDRPLSDRNYATLYSTPVVIWETNCPLVRIMLRNKEVRKQLMAFGFEEKDLTAYQVMAWLMKWFTPKDHIQRTIDDLIAKWRSQSDMLVGLQIRLGGNEAAWGLDTAEFISHSDVQNFYRCANDLTVNKTALFFLATDTTSVATEAKEKFFDKLRIFDGMLIHSDRLGEYDDEEVERGVQKVIIDNYLLSQCDELIITAGSTFGGIAAMRAGKLPLFVGQHSRTCLLADIHKGPGIRLSGKPETMIY